MSIHDKIADIQMELLDVEFEQKRGYHAEYMSLEVLTCKILPLCYKHRLFYYFTANDTHLLLKIFDRETGECLSPAPHVRLPELSQDMKVEGGNYTYMKRYLIMNTFHIIAESFDPEQTVDGLPESSNTNNNNDDDENTGFQKLIDDAVVTLELQNKPVIYKTIRQEIMDKNDFSDKERKELLSSIRGYCDKKVKKGEI